MKISDENDIKALFIQETTFNLPFTWDMSTW